MKPCDWCGGPIPARARRDAITCSKPCRQARHRFARAARDATAAALHDPSPLTRARHDASPRGRHDGSRPPGHPSHADRALQTRRIAYADPPYPGMAGYYRDHPDYAGEVDHRKLLSRLATYDGWALSTSARALPAVLSICVAQDLAVRVAAWVKGERAHINPQDPLNAWEPVIYSPARRGGARRVDTLTHGVSPMTTLPGRVIGAKPVAFSLWMLGLINARPGDEFDDLYPGSGAVGRAWVAFDCGYDVSRVDAALRHDALPTSR